MWRRNTECSSAPSYLPPPHPKELPVAEVRETRAAEGTESTEIVGGTWARCEEGLVLWLLVRPSGSGCIETSDKMDLHGQGWCEEGIALWLLHLLRWHLCDRLSFIINEMCPISGTMLARNQTSISPLLGCAPGSSCAVERDRQSRFRNWEKGCSMHVPTQRIANATDGVETHHDFCPVL